MFVIFLTAITEILYLQLFIKDCSLYLTLEKNSITSLQELPLTKSCDQYGNWMTLQEKVKTSIKCSWGQSWTVATELMTTSASRMTLATNNFWVKTSSNETTLVDFYFNYYKYLLTF